MKDIEFKSQICTVCEQSWQLLSSGLKHETADMYLEMYNLPSYEDYHVHVVTKEMDLNNLFSVRHDIVPAWSLSRLLDMMPKEISYQIPGFIPYHPELTMFNSGYVLTVKKDTYDCLVATHKEEDLFDACISMIRWLIKREYFNKDYLI